MTSLPRTRAELAALIDHTLLKPEARHEDIDQLCRECQEFGFHAACVNPLWVPRCVRWLFNESTRVATVVGFPLGASTTPVKALEAQSAVAHGATEVDMVANLAALIGNERPAATRDIAVVVAAVKEVNEQAIVKVILETAVLTDEQIILGCRCAREAEADFVKTSTGFHPAGGATAAHVALLREHAGPLGVKAAGGIRDLAAAQAMLTAGANRLGMSASVAVVRSLPE